MLINFCFNVSSYIATIHSANMNPSVPQYKNCWKWEHTTFICYFQGARCLKWNSPHKVEHHHHFVWYYKANFKINPSCLETKQSKLYFHSFKCINCKSDHQADSNLYPFWHYCFNKEWHMKKYQELHDSKAQLICSIVNGNKQWLLKISKFSYKTCKRIILLLTQFWKPTSNST